MLVTPGLLFFSLWLFLDSPFTSFFLILQFSGQRRVRLRFPGFDMSCDISGESDGRRKRPALAIEYGGLPKNED
jgi:hypothetical protein